MTNYAWSATDKSGNQVIKEIQAATVEDAKYVLLSQGYSNLVLKEDELTSVVLAGFPKRQNALGQELKITAAQRLKHREDLTVTYWDVLRKGIGRHFLGFLALFFFVAYSGFSREWAYFVVYTVALLGWLAYVLYQGLLSVYYRKLHQAADWSQWNKVLSLVATLQLIGRYRKVKIPASELTRYRARAFVGLGRLNEGLEEYKQCEGQPDCPRWLYQLFVGSLYATAKQYDRALEYNLASIATKPTSVAWLDLAYRYARYQKDPVKARAAMAEAEKSPLADFIKPFHIRCQGVIAYLEGDHAAAKRHLELAIDLVEKARGRPYRDGHLSVARAYLCCVLARQGDLPAAKKCLALAKKYLIATREDELLAECRELCGEK